jgi:hypothetical protein
MKTQKLTPEQVTIIPGHHRPLEIQLAITALWKQSPGDLISLWDMLQFAGREIAEALGEIKMLPETGPLQDDGKPH